MNAKKKRRYWIIYDSYYSRIEKSLNEPNCDNHAGPFNTFKEAKKALIDDYMFSLKMLQGALNSAVNLKAKDID